MVIRELRRGTKDRAPATDGEAGACKMDLGKPPVVRGCLAYFPMALTAVAKVSEYGAEKYKNRDYAPHWRDVPNGEARYTDADGRHLLDEFIDGDYDEESGLLHAAQHAWDALARLELKLRSGLPLRQPDTGKPE